jgi:hypothetical protein
MAASLLSCAKALEVADVAGCGRGVVTTRAVGAGEVLLSAVPYAVALDFPWLDNVCLGCAKTSRKPLSLRCEVRARGPGRRLLRPLGAARRHRAQHPRAGGCAPCSAH